MELVQSIKQIGVFMICAQVILHFKPSVKYEKYLKLLLSVMVLVQILIPVVNAFSGKSSVDFYMRIEEIQTEIDKNMEQLEIENAINEENILNQTLEEIKLRINNDAEGSGLHVKRIEYNDENVLILYVEQSSTRQDISIEVEKVSIGEQEVVGKAIVDENGEMRNKLQMLSNAAARESGIQEEQIEVILNEQ